MPRLKVDNNSIYNEANFLDFCLLSLIILRYPPYKNLKVFLFEFYLKNFFLTVYFYLE